MLIFRVPVWRNVTSYQHPVAHHVEASVLFWVSRKHSRLVFVAVAHPVKLFNWGERSLTPEFRSKRMIHFDPNEHDCNPGLSPRLAIVRNGRGLIYGQLFVWKDEEVRTVEVPAQFEKLIKKEGLRPVFEKLSYTHRKEYCRWITDAKKEETRLKRLGKAIEMLKKGVRTPG